MKGFFMPIRKIGFLELSGHLNGAKKMGHVGSPSNLAFRKLLEAMKTQRINKVSSDAELMRYTFRKSIPKLISERLSSVFPEVSKGKIEKDLKKLLLKHGVAPDSDSINKGMMLLVTVQEIRNLIHFIEPSAMGKVKELLSQKGRIMEEISKYIQIDGNIKREIDGLFEELREMVDALDGDVKVDYRTNLVHVPEKKEGEHSLVNKLQVKESGAHVREKGSRDVGKGETTQEKKGPLNNTVRSDVGKVTVMEKSTEGYKQILSVIDKVKNNNHNAIKSKPDAVDKVLRVMGEIAVENNSKDVKVRVNVSERRSGMSLDVRDAGIIMRHEQHGAGGKLLLSAGKPSENDYREFENGKDKGLSNAVSDFSVSNRTNITSKVEGQTPFLGGNQRVLSELVTRQIVERMDVALANGQREIVMELQPPHLGKLRIQVLMHGNNISANFWTPFSDVKAIIESGLAYLQQHFQEQGMNPQAFSVFVGGGQTSERREEVEYGASGSGGRLFSSLAEDEGETRMGSVANGYYLVNLVG